MDWWQHDPQGRMPSARDLVAMAMSHIAAERRLAFELIFRRYQETVLRKCGSMLDGDRAVDATQECFARAFSKLLDRDGPADPDKLEGWLVVIARNVAFEQYRSSRQVPVPELDAAFDDPAEHARTEASRVADEQRRLGRRTRVRQGLDVVAATLTPAQQHVYDLNVRHELVGQQLADRLGTSPAQASRQANEVRGLVRDGFGAYVLALWALHVWRTEHAEICRRLGDILAREGWNGDDFTTKLRQDIHQHLKSCDTCRERRDQKLRPFAPVVFPLLFLPLLSERMRATVPPVSTQTQITTDPSAAHPEASRRSRRKSRSRNGKAGITAGVVVIIAAAGLVAGPRIIERASTQKNPPPAGQQDGGPGASGNGQSKKTAYRLPAAACPLITQDEAAQVAGQTAPCQPFTIRAGQEDRNLDPFQKIHVVALFPGAFDLRFEPDQGSLGMFKLTVWDLGGNAAAPFATACATYRNRPGGTAGKIPNLGDDNCFWALSEAGKGQRTVFVRRANIALRVEAVASGGKNTGSVDKADELTARALDRLT